MSQPRQEGTLKTWNDLRGTGVITSHGNGQEVPVHISAFPEDGYLPTEGEVLTFEVEPDNGDGPVAVRLHRFAESASFVAKAGCTKGRKFRMSKAPRRAESTSSKMGQRLAVVLLIVLLAVITYSRYTKKVGQLESVGGRAQQLP